MTQKGSRGRAEETGDKAGLGEVFGQHVQWDLGVREWVLGVYKHREKGA